MTKSRYQGDLKMSIGDNGATCAYIGGQPVLTQSIVNEMLIRLYTKPGWFGNAFTGDSLEKIGSLFEEEAAKAITSQTPNRVRFAIESALAPMADPSYLRATFEVIVTNPEGNILDTVIKAFSPIIGSAELGLIKYSDIWVATATEPD